MAGLYARVASRGFESGVVTDESTGAAALAAQGGPVDPAHGQDVTTAAPSQVLTGYQPETPAPPDSVILEGTWGLPGQLADPDQTPDTHAAPVPGWAGSYLDTEAIAVLQENSALIHAQDFGALRRHTDTYGVTEVPASRWQANDPGETVLEPVSGQIQAMGGYDITQGYSLSNRYGFNAGHKDRTQISGTVINAYLDPGERPFIVPQANGTFVPTDAVQGPEPFSSMLSADNVNPDDPSAYAAPPVPDTLAVPLPGAPATAGWW